jgi:hypothetical protein
MPKAQDQSGMNVHKPAALREKEESFFSASVRAVRTVKYGIRAFS